MSTIAISVAADVWGPASHIWLAGCGTCVYVSGYLAPYICPLDRFSYGWNMSTIGISGRGQTSGMGGNVPHLAGGVWHVRATVFWTCILYGQRIHSASDAVRLLSRAQYGNVRVFVKPVNANNGRLANGKDNDDALCSKHGVQCIARRPAYAQPNVAHLPRGHLSPEHSPKTFTPLPDNYHCGHLLSPNMTLTLT